MSGSPKAWTTAARLHTLPAAAAPVLVGSGLAAGAGVFRLDGFLAALAGALAIQVAANFANDASDAARGADTAERAGPPRMVALGVISSRDMWWGVTAALTVAALAGAYLITIAGWVIAAIGVASIVAMLGYVGGPVPYGYRGFGELFVFAFFGLVATVGSRYVHDGTAPADAWILAIPMGMMASAILVANNLRDLDTDARVGKRTLAVIIGRARTRRLYVGLIATSFLAIAVGVAIGVTPPATGLAVLVAPFAAPPIRAVLAERDGPHLVGVLKSTARLQLWMGVVLAVTAAAG
ncbi:MAG: 1,4-dihydroxy-2-naphthoate polyprenyltransferase [Acidimicrobiia bacterium]